MRRALAYLKRVGRGRAIWSGVDAAASPVGALLMTAGLARALGAQHFGVLVVLLAVSSLSTAINPAIATTTTKFVSEAVGSNTSGAHTVARVVTASLLVVIVVDLAFLSATGLFRDSLARLMFGDDIARNTADIGMLLVLAFLTVCVQQIDGVFAAAIKGLERFRQQALFEIGSRLATAGVAIAAGWWTRDVRIVLLAQLGMCALSGSLRAWVLRTLAPEPRVLANPDRQQFRQIIRFGSWMWLYAIATAAFTLDRVIVGRILGPAAAAVFQIYVQLAWLIHYVPASLFAFLFPVFSRLGAAGPDHWLAIVALYRRSRLRIAGLALAITLFMLAFGERLPGLLAGKVFAVEQGWSFQTLAGGYLLTSFNIASYYLLLGSGASRTVALTTAVAVLGMLGLSVPLITVWGLEGAATARFAFGLVTLLLVYQAHKVLRASAARQSVRI